MQKNGTAVKESDYSKTTAESDSDNSAQSNQSTIYRLDASDVS